MEDEEGNSLKGVTEIMIAKNRHGSLENVKLRFIPEFTKFTELEDLDFGGMPADTIQEPYGNIITRPSKMNSDEDIPF